MNLEEYKKLIKIRILWDEVPSKAKQLLTDLIKRFEIENIDNQLKRDSEARRDVKFHQNLRERGKRD